MYYEYGKNILQSVQGTDWTKSPQMYKLAIIVLLGFRAQPSWIYHNAKHVDYIRG